MGIGFICFVEMSFICSCSAVWGFLWNFKLATAVYDCYAEDMDLQIKQSY